MVIYGPDFAVIISARIWEIQRIFAPEYQPHNQLFLCTQYEHNQLTVDLMELLTWKIFLENSGATYSLSKLFVDWNDPKMKKNGHQTPHWTSQMANLEQPVAQDNFIFQLKGRDNYLGKRSSCRPHTQMVSWRNLFH